MRARLSPVVGLFLAAGLAPGGAAAQSSYSDMTYTSVSPCRILDTRQAGGSMAGNQTRDFRITGVGLQQQGGAQAGCNIPVGVAKAAILNFVAVNPTGPGNLRAWAYSTPPVGPPVASILNYASATIANGIAVPLCDTASTTCPFDLRVFNEGVFGTHLLVDVVGYFSRTTGGRYVVSAPPAQVGRVVPLDSARMDQLCRDEDGCEVTVQMVNWAPVAQPGNVASRSQRLFVSQNSRWWRFSNVDVDGGDGNGVLNEWATWDCIFTDAETYTGVANGRADPGIGFALLNVAGGDYSDTAVTCRIVVED
jgi:hypothetical protein